MNDERNRTDAPNRTDERRSEIVVPCERIEKARWVRAAQGRKMKLVEWAREILNSRSGQ